MVHYFPTFTLLCLPHLDQSCFAGPCCSEDDNLGIINLKLILGFIRNTRTQPLHNWCVPSRLRDWGLVTSRASPLWMLLSWRTPGPGSLTSELEPNSKWTNNSETEPTNLSSVAIISSYHTKLNSQKLCMHCQCSAYCGILKIDYNM